MFPRCRSRPTVVVHDTRRNTLRVIVPLTVASRCENNRLKKIPVPIVLFDYWPAEAGRYGDGMKAKKGPVRNYGTSVFASCQGTMRPSPAVRTLSPKFIKPPPFEWCFAATMLYYGNSRGGCDQCFSPAQRIYRLSRRYTDFLRLQQLLCTWPAFCAIQDC